VCNQSTVGEAEKGHLAADPAKRNRSQLGTTSPEVAFIFYIKSSTLLCLVKMQGKLKIMT
jgi:hypothetical protein